MKTYPKDRTRETKYNEPQDDEIRDFCDDYGVTFSEFSRLWTILGVRFVKSNGIYPPQEMKSPPHRGHPAASRVSAGIGHAHKSVKCPGIGTGNLRSRILV